jgi:hypothetical protein
MSGIHVHEEHGEVVGTWGELGYRNETVVCFDRHLDLKPLTAEALAALQRADDVSTLNRALPVREIAGAYGLDDFFATGPVLSRVRRLVWVVPGNRGGPGAARQLLHAVSLIAADPALIDRCSFAGGRLLVRLCDLDVEICDVAALRRRGVEADLRIDVDLDWFADQAGPLECTAADFTNLIEQLGAADRVDSITYSIRSGFLAEDYRYLAAELARSWGRRMATVERPDAQPLPERSFAMLRSGQPVSRDQAERVTAGELGDADPLGHVLAGLLIVDAAPDEAACCWQAASEQGTSSTWLAYRLAMRHYRERAYGEALHWLDAAAGDGVDTLEAHAAVLRPTCLVRLGRVAEALTEAERLRQRYPLRADLLRVGRIAAGRLGDHESAGRFTRHEEKLAALVGDAA